MSRITPSFERLRNEGRCGFVAFITAGYPSLAETPLLARALVQGGADILEIGVPFSDPLAEGATIQRASHAALRAAVTPADCIASVRAIRDLGIEAPILLMGYYNPIMSYNEAAFARDAAAAGADGLIVVDAPPEEAASLQSACHAHGLDLVFLLAPTSSDERIERVAAKASGFIYCVSLTGVTGAREALPPGLADFIARVRAGTSLPLAVGFGISRREHVEAIAGFADAFVIGSAIIDIIDESPPQERAERVKQYAEVVSGRQTGGAGHGAARTE